MRLQIFSFSLVTAFISLMMACAPAANNNDNVAERMDDAKDEAFDRERDKFEANSYYEIGYNEGRIKEIKMNMDKDDKDYAEKKQKIEELDQKNKELKKRLDKNDDEQQTAERWNEFKTEFKNDMDELGGALKGFFRDEDRNNKQG